MLNRIWTNFFVINLRNYLFERNETFLIVTNDQKGALYGIGELTDEELEKLK